MMCICTLNPAESNLTNPRYMEPKDRNIQPTSPPVPPPLTPLVFPPHAQRQGTESGGGGLDVAPEGDDADDDAQHVRDVVSVEIGRAHV